MPCPFVAHYFMLQYIWCITWIKLITWRCVYDLHYVYQFLLNWHFSTEFLFGIDSLSDYISIICYEITPAFFEENYYELIKLSSLNFSAKKKYAFNELISNQCNSAMVPIRLSPVLYIQKCFLTISIWRTHVFHFYIIIQFYEDFSNRIFLIFTPVIMIFIAMKNMISNKRRYFRTCYSLNL